MGEFDLMKDLQTLLASLDRDPKGGKLLLTESFVQKIRAARPLDSHGLLVLAQCLEACSEQMYEHYRVLIDIFREEIRQLQPDEETIRLGIALGILDDEEWEG